MTVLERSEHVAEWVRLTGEKIASSGASCAAGKSTTGKPIGKGAPPAQKAGGINAAVRELGIDRTEAQRAVKIDKITAPPSST